MAAFAITALLAGLSVGSCMFYAAAFLSALYTGWRRRWIVVAAFAAVIAASLAVSVATVDFSTDGSLYHQSTIAAIAAGWNPYWQPDAPYILWTLHYAKLVEIMQACVVAAFGDIEVAKCVNLLFVASLCFLGWDELRRQGLSRVNAAGGVVVLGCCPVVLAQALTTYVDFYSYIYISLSLIAMLRIERGEGKSQWFFLLSITLLAEATKFTIFFYQGLALIAWLLLDSFRRRWALAWRIALLGAVSFALAGLLFWHPYMTNWIGYGHPFYPLVGMDGMDIMTDNTPVFYSSLNRVSAFGASLVRSWGNPFGWRNHTDHSEGFGPWFVAIIAIGVIYLFIKRPRSPKALACCYVAACALLGCLSVEQSWWARYVAFAWVAAVAVYILLPSGLWRRAVVAFALLTAYQSAVCVKTAFLHRDSVSVYKEILTGKKVRIEAPAQPNLTFLLDSWDVDYAEADTLNPERCIVLTGPYAIVETDSAEYAEIVRRLKQLPR